MTKLWTKILKTILGLIIITLVSLVIGIFIIRQTARNRAIKALEELTYMVSSEGCYNESLKTSIEASLNTIYGVAYKSDTNNDGVIDNHDTSMISFDNNCTSVSNSAGNSLYNDNTQSYLNHVQRGEPIVCSMTVTINYRTPVGMFGVGEPIFIHENITVSSTVISNRWFKGDI